MKTASVFDAAQIIALVAGVLIPFVVALLAKVDASPAVKSMVAFLSAALLALATYLTNTDGSRTWQGALSVFAIALVSAASSRVTVTGGADTKLAEAVPGGIG